MDSMLNRLGNSTARIVGGMMESRGALLAVLLTLFLVVEATLIGLIPTIFGSAALGIFAGLSIGKLYIYAPASSIDDVTTRNNSIVETEIVPYNSWPDKCYICDDEVEEDMEIRGQFVVHKGESESQTKAVPLCEECTWTHSTLIDNHDMLVGIYDERQETTEL